jgi:hypothetical protein
MPYRGLRVGILLSLVIRAGRFPARSKGKDIAGELPPEALAAGPEAPVGLPSLSPRLSTWIIRATTNLAKAKTIPAPF